jgi:hypothetical protein
MWHPLLPDVARLWQEQQQQEAERDRVLGRVRATTPGFGARFLLCLGGLLVAAGLRLQRRYRAATYPSPEIRRSGC